MMIERLDLPNPLSLGPLVSRIPSFRFARSSKWVQNKICASDCSAALIAELSVSEPTSQFLLTYLKPDLTKHKVGPTQEILLDAWSGRPNLHANLSILESLKVCCVGYTAIGTAEDFRNGIACRLYLFVFGWNKISDSLHHVAKSVIKVSQFELAGISENTIWHKANVDRKEEITFFPNKRRLFCMYTPEGDRHRYCLIYLMYRDKFVPITGNYPAYPGLYLLPESEYFLTARDYWSREDRLFVGRVIDSETHGRSYEFCKLILG